MIEKPPKLGKSQYRNALKMLSNQECLDKIRSINDKYYYWDKVKYLNTTENYSSQDYWAAIKLLRQIDYKYLVFGKYTFSFAKTEYIQKILHEFDMHIGGNLGSRTLLPEEGKDRYLLSSIMEEAIASSQMEGAVTTRKKAKDMLRKNDKPKSRSDQMIVNNYQTIQHIVNHKDDKLTPEKLLEIHKLISRKTLDDSEEEGAFRENNDVYIVNYDSSEIVHSPPAYKEIPDLINQICDFFNESNHDFFIHPVLKGIIIHFLIGYVHPFVDGNGRTARALFYWYLLSKGYWLTEYLSISRLIIKSKNQYEKAYLYTESDNNDLTYFINYNLKTMELSYEALRKYIQRKIDEKRYLTDYQRIPGINERQAQILKLFYEESNIVITVKEVETRFIVSNQTARSDLMSLVESGFLEIIQANKKKQLFVKSSDFEMLLERYI